MTLSKIAALFISLSAVLFANFAPAFSGVVESDLWQTEKSQHFIIYYQEASSEFVNELIRNSEDYYNSILDELGYRRFDFWSWDNRAKIYLHNDNAGYQSDAQRALWSGAMVNVGSRTIKTFIGQSGFFNSMLPHEMTHIIFREFVGEKANLPLWIDEGVACSQEESSLPLRLSLAKEMLTDNEYTDLEKFSTVNGSVASSAQAFYAQAASIVTFMMRRFGRDVFFDFSRRLRDGAGWKEAILSAYRFENIAEFEKEWKNFILTKIN
jgi:hypothetical protein